MLRLIPPSNSSHHALYDCELLCVLENSITTYSTEGKVCLVGDLNRRTADYNDFITDDSVHSSLQDRLNNLFTYTNDLCLSKRMNPDKVMQVYWIKDTKRSSWKRICDWLYVLWCYCIICDRLFNIYYRFIQLCRQIYYF